MPEHNLQNTWGMIADIFRETSPAVRWCFVGGMVLGVSVYLCGMMFLSPVRFFLRSSFFFWLFLAFLVGGGILGIGVGVGIEGIGALLRRKNKKDERGRDRRR